MNPVDPNSPVPVAIIGMACLFPKADGLAAYWSNIRNRVDAITEVPSTHWRPEDYFDDDPKAADRTYARRGGFLPPVDFPPLDFGIAPNNLEATDTTQLLGLMVARQALDDAGYGESTDRGKALDRSRVSTILGVTGTLELVIPLGARLGHPIWRRALKEAGVPAEQSEDVVRRIADSYVGWQENSFPGLLGNVAAGRIANRLDLGGTNCVIDAACASSVGALNLALLELAAGRCDVALSGGLDTFNDIFMYMCFSKTPALSPRGDARPFDAGCDGTILGEGLGVLVLKRLDDARRDGDKVYAVIRSVGSSSDGKGNAVYAPSASGQARCLRDAYDRAGITPDSIELVEAHGTGTRVGDATELAALGAVYSEAKPGATWCALGSVKSQIGHTKAAAGAAGVIKAALALHHKVLPPTIKVDRPVEGVGPGRSPFYVNTEPRPWLPRAGHPRRAAVSAFGFGGSNFHCVLEEADPVKAEIDWDGSVHLLAFSGRSREALKTAIDAWPAGLDATALRHRAALSRQAFRADDPHRVVIVAATPEEAATRLAAARAGLDEPTRPQHVNGAATRPRGGVFHGHGKAPGGLAVLFPGQGSQYVGMLRDLACQFPALQDALAEADALDGDRADGGRLVDRVYPLSAFDEAERDANDAALRATEVAQPAIGAVSLGLYRVLQHFGLRADAMAGHSFGELTALCASGRLDDQAFARLGRERGRLMAEQAARGGGAMLAVMAPLGVVEEVLIAEGLDGSLVVANKNGPRQFVLSGPSAAIERAAMAFGGRNVATRALAVSAAFHSPEVAGASGPFLEALGGASLRAGRVPVYANTTAQPYPADTDAARALLAGQLARPVEFAAMVEAMADAGIGTFLEVGPDAKLTGLVRSILDAPGRPARALAVDASRGATGNLADLASTLAELAALGYPVDLNRWDPDAANLAPARKPGLTVKLTGANHSTRASRPAPAATPKPATASAPPASPPTPTPTTAPTVTAPPRSPAKASAPTSTPPPVASPMTTPPSPPSTTTPTPSPTPTQADGASHAGAGRNGHHPAPTPAAMPPAPAPTPTPALSFESLARPAADATVVSEAIRAAQENLVALQRLSAQTADLHRQFLDGQDRTQRTFQSLLDQQQRLTLTVLGAAPSPPVQPLPPLRQVGPVTQASPPRAVSPPVAPPAPPAPAPAPVRTVVTAPPVVVAPTVAPSRPASVAPAVVSTPAPVASPVTSSTGAAHITHTLLDVVAEKTGYPAEMLEPSMLLDADLGIDSIKRVEILSALQERLPEAPAVKPEHLGTLRSLQDIIDFLAADATTVAVATPAAASPTTASAPAVAAGTVQTTLLAVVAEKTGYPAEMLEPSMLLDADLGIDSIKRVEILSALQERLPEAPAVKPEHLGTLRSLQDIIDFLAQGTFTTAVTGAAPAGTPSTAPDVSAVRTTLLAVVAEKTGYPAEMLEPSMLLDADLGIDSIKRVEILSALQERLPEAPAVKPENLGTLRSLQDIIDFLAADARATTVAAAAPAVAAPCPAAPQAAPAASESLPVMRLVVRSKEAPRHDGAEPHFQAVRPDGAFWVFDDGAGLAPGIVEALQRRGFAARLIGRDPLEALVVPARLDGLVLVAPPGGEGDRHLKAAFRVLRTAGPALRAAGAQGGALVATVARLDGAFGTADLPADAEPAAGGLAGLAKTAGHEWPEVGCRAIDLDPALGQGPDAAEAVVAEILRPGPVEVGLTRAGRSTLELDAVPIDEASPGSVTLATGDVVVITGGARGVTAEVAVALGQAFQPTLVLFGRSPAPEVEPDWLAGLASEADIKRTLAHRAKGHATPQSIGEQARRVVANREIRQTLDRIQAAGATADYRSVDVRDPAAVAAALDEIRRAHGPIRGLVHGAGVLADRRIEDKTDEQFASVYDTKVAGLRALIDALTPDELRLLVLFSSTTARFGRIGQVAYAAANEVLNKFAQREARRRPDCRVISVNWGPWDGGMVTPSLRGVFAAEGVGLIPLEAGARYLVREIQQAGERPVEVVVLGGHELPAAVAPRVAAPRPAGSTPPATSEPAETAPLTTVFERPLSLAALPILRSHAIDGRGVVPMALTLEWLAQGALQRNPGLVLSGVEDLRLFKGVVLHDDRSETLAVLVGKARRDGGRFRVPVELRGVVDGDRTIVHARAEVVLADRPHPATVADRLTPVVQPAYPRSIRSVYHDVLFHGPDLHAIEAIDQLGPAGFSAVVTAGARPETWMERPLRQAWLTDPLGLDAAFQLMTLWAAEQAGAPSLPTQVGRYSQFVRSFPAGKVRVLARIERPAEHRAVAEIEVSDLAGAPIARIEGYECVIDGSLIQAFRRNRIAAGKAVPSPR